MHYGKIFLFAVVLAYLTAMAYSEDDNALSGAGGYLDTSDNSAKQDIKETMGGEGLFNSGQGGSVLGAGKKVPVAVTRDMLPSAAKNAETATTTATAAAPSSAAGRLSLTLTDNEVRSANLILSQSGDVIFGRGYIVTGNTTQDVSAAGSVTGSEINLDLLTMNDITLFRLDLNLSGSTLAGDYTAYSATSAPWTGRAEGSFS